MFTPKKVNPTLTTYRPQKCFFTLLIRFDITAGILCDNSLSSTYQSIVHCVPSILFFAKKLS